MKFFIQTACQYKLGWDTDDTADVINTRILFFDSTAFFTNTFE